MAAMCQPAMYKSSSLTLRELVLVAPSISSGCMAELGEVGLGLSKVLKKVLKKVNLLKKVLKKVNLLKKALKKSSKN